MAALLSASMLAPAFGAPQAVSAASLAKKLAATLKIAKRADKNAKRAIAGLQSQGQGGGTGGQGGQGLAGPAGPKGDKGDPGSASNTGATGATGATGPAGPTGSKGDTGAACTPSTPGCQGPPGAPGSLGTPVVVTASVSAAYGAIGENDSVTCPDYAPHVVGGGFEIGTSYYNVATVLDSRPLAGGGGWDIKMRNDQGGGATLPYSIWAVCVL